MTVQAERQAGAAIAAFVTRENLKAAPTPGFAHAPYHVETYPIGSCVCNAQGFNCLSFPDQPGVKFTTLANAERICADWNGVA